MKRGKYICDQLKQIRLDIARANGIKYAPRECHHEGDCQGTCPACESEVRYLEREIARRRSHGKVALIAGVSLGMMSFTATSCDQISQTVKELIHPDDEWMGEVTAGDVQWTDSIDEAVITSGEVVDSVNHPVDSVDEMNADAGNK